MRAGRTLRNIIITDIVMILTMLVFLTAHAVCGQGWMLSAYVTSLTGSYHFTMRLIVGQIMILYYRKHPPRPGSFTTRSFAFEPELYRRLNVKSWKNRLITARPDQFDMKNLTPAEMLRSMVQAETGHSYDHAAVFPAAAADNTLRHCPGVHHHISAGLHDGSSLRHYTEIQYPEDHQVYGVNWTEMQMISCPSIIF